MATAIRTDHRRILALTWPVLLANLSLPLVGTVDTAIMGRYPDPSFIGAVALGATVFTSVGWLFGFLRMGTTGQVAQAFGRGAISEVTALLQRSLRLAGTIAAVLLILSPWLLPWLIAGFGASDSTSARALSYLGIRVWALPAMLSYLVLLGGLFGCQQMRAALVTSLVLNLSSTGLSLLLAVGFDLGLQGIAWGSLIADWLSALCALAYVQRYLRREGCSLLKPQRTALQQGQRSNYLSMNLDLLVRSLFVQAPFLIYAAVGARLGDVVLAANAILMQLFFILVFALDAFAHSAETLAGACYGRRDRMRLEQVVQRTLYWSFALAGVGSLVFLLGTDTLVALLSESDAVRAEAAQYRFWLVAAPLASALAFQLDGVFIGCTQTRIMRNSMLIAFTGFAAVIAIGVPRIGNHALWLGLLLFMLLRGALLWRGLTPLYATAGQPD
ncbi:MAG: MATE family efflux transporter [Pseudomonadota bacterium]